jgi:transposase
VAVQGCDEGRSLQCATRTGLAEALLGLEGFRVLAVDEDPDELVVTIETTVVVVGCGRCGTKAEAHDRKTVDIRDLACFGRPARLRWIKRRWRCIDPDCDAKTWTEPSRHVDAQVVLTRRAGAEACRQVGEEARAVSVVAAELGVCWWTVMNAVIEHGTPLVDDPDRIGVVAQLGIDETTYLSATRLHPTIYATGLVDLKARVVIDLVEGNAAADLRRWTAGADPRWLERIEVVATDLAESFRAGLSPHLSHARRVADPFHVVRAGNRCLEKVRRRVQNETLGHRGRKDDPLYRIRKLLVSGAERLDERGSGRMLLGLRVGDSHDEVLGAWLAKESLRDVYLTDDPAVAETLLAKAIAGVRPRRGGGDPLARQHPCLVAT